MNIKLFTRAGGFVHEAKILPFHIPPDIIQWGSRFFTYQGTVESPEPHWAYSEGMVYPLIQGLHT